VARAGKGTAVHSRELANNVIAFMHDKEHKQIMFPQGSHANGLP
jgi:hypothetical protein